MTAALYNPRLPMFSPFNPNLSPVADPLRGACHHVWDSQVLWHERQSPQLGYQFSWQS